MSLNLVYLTEVDNSNQNQVEARQSRTSTRLQKLRRSGFSSNSDKKTLENYEYSHFEENELSDFPGYLEAAQLLNSLTAKMNFKVGDYLKTKFNCCPNYIYIYISIFSKASSNIGIR